MKIKAKRVGVISLFIGLITTVATFMVNIAPRMFTAASDIYVVGAGVGCLILLVVIVVIIDAVIIGLKESKKDGNPNA